MHGTTEITPTTFAIRTLVLAIVLGVLIVRPPASIAQDFPFSTTPDWLSNRTFTAKCIAVGDVNLDGYLDLVYANRDNPTTLFLNTRSTQLFSTDTTWAAVDAGETEDVVLGDVDNDGDLDLVCGGRPTRLYRNEDGILQRTPEWSNSDAWNTRSIALGKVNEDDFLDLVCGNENQPCILYLNTGGTFADTSWASVDLSQTVDVALGDVTGDDKPDLICGNYADSNTVYKNLGRVFTKKPAWISKEAEETLGVVMADVDGANGLDLVCGNIGQYNGQDLVVYLNRGTMLGDTVGVRVSIFEGVLKDICAGDVDKDGDVDVAVASYWPDYPQEGFIHVFWNDGGRFSSAGFIRTGSSMPEGLALVDIDANGFVDLVCEKDGRHTAYLNQQGLFPSAPESLPSGRRAFAIGRVDEDPFPDMVCAGDDTLVAYRLTEGRFSGEERWARSVPGAAGVALGHIDSDPYLDLVSITSEGPLLFSGTSGLAFSDAGARIDSTWDYDWRGVVLLEQILGDSLLDLVVSGGYFPSDGADYKVYLNRAGSLSGEPFWHHWYCHGVAVPGYVDEDNRLDLVVGSFSETGCLSAIYYGAEAILFQAPPISFGSPTNTTDLELGDVDGDEDLDLVCAEMGVIGVHVNDGHELEGTLRHICTGDRLVLGDVNWDGNVDMICNDGSVTELYRNSAGSYGIGLVWSDTTGAVSDMCLEDMDCDGDLDLVCGGYYNACSLYYNGSAPPFVGNMSTPANHMANNSGFLRFVDVRKNAGNTYRVTMTGFDIESDPIYVWAEYQFKGDPEWFPANVNSPTGRTGPFATSPEGVESSFDWDTSTVPSDRRDVVLRLRTVENPKRVAMIQHVGTYAVEVGRISPIRGKIELTPEGAVSFAAVTVGDTTYMDLTVSNSGNGTLDVTGVDLPRIAPREMHVSASEFSISPSAARTIRVWLHPIRADDIDGDIQIHSTDPLTPTRVVPMEADIRSLEVRTEWPPYEGKEEVPAVGTPIAVTVTPKEVGTAIGPRERAYLYYRSALDTLFADSNRITLRNVNNIRFEGTIDSSRVVEEDFHFYIKVENVREDTVLSATDPPNAPDSGYFEQTVLPPASVTAWLEQNGGKDIAKGFGAQACVSLPPGSKFESGTLHVRRGGEQSYRTVGLYASGEMICAEIPASLVDERGLEYVVQVDTKTAGGLTDPPANPFESPNIQQVTIGALQEAGSHDAHRYRMITVPLESDSGTTLHDLLLVRLGPYDPVEYRALRWDRDSNGERYWDLSARASAPKGCFDIKPGKGFWFISKEPHQLNVAPPNKGLSTPTGKGYEITLAKGWNQIGNPFVFPVGWDTVTPHRLGADVLVPGLVDRPRRYVSGDYNDALHDPVLVLSPFEGYFVQSDSDGVVLEVPPIEFVPAGTSQSDDIVDSGKLAPRGGGQEEKYLWLLRVEASSGGAQDRYNYVGVGSSAKDQWDYLDGVDPPLSPGNALSLYFPHRSWSAHAGYFEIDIRGELNTPEQSGADATVEGVWGYSWPFDVAKTYLDDSAGDEVTLTFSGLERVPEENDIFLMDRILSRSVDLRKVESYAYALREKAYVPRDEDARFVLVVGSEAYVESQKNWLAELPTTTTLHQNFPNPFNPSTVVRYDIAKTGAVTIRIYNVRGERVRELYNGFRPQGRYEAAWDGRNDQGSPVSSGMYFCRLQTGEKVITRKMLLIK